MYFQVYFSPGTTDISTLPKQVKGDLQVRAQGEDKPSPLLCLRSSLPSHFVHSRGDGLSSPWGFLTLDGHARLQKSHARRPRCAYDFCMAALASAMPGPAMLDAIIVCTPHHARLSSTGDCLYATLHAC